MASNGFHLDQFRIEYPKLPIPFVGSGDLFTALLTAWLTKSGGNYWPKEMDIPAALEKTVATMQAVLNRTLMHYNQSKEGEGTPGKTEESAIKELKLIQSREQILNPKILHKAERVVI